MGKAKHNATKAGLHQSIASLIELYKDPFEKSIKELSDRYKADLSDPVVKILVDNASFFRLKHEKACRNMSIDVNHQVGLLMTPACDPVSELHRMTLLNKCAESALKSMKALEDRLKAITIEKEKTDEKSEQEA